jgi:diguanylate cyclase (GGDEF)-like protein
MPVRRYVLPPIFALVIAAMAPAARAGGPLDVPAELDAIARLSEQSPPRALARLEELNARLDPATPYELRQKILRSEVELRRNAGQLEAAYAAEQRAYQLAVDNNDPAAAVRASLWEVWRLLDRGRPDDAQAALDVIVKKAPRQLPATVMVALARAQGDILNFKAQFDKALQSYLQALALLQGKPEASPLRAALYRQIAQVYINNDHPEKAVEFTRLGLEEPHATLRVRASLQFTQGLGLIRMAKHAQGVEAFRKALAITRGAELWGLEASIRGNIADYYLRREDYPRAEQESRKALEVASKVSDENHLMMAKANLGFALMGQGRLAEGLGYIDAVIGQLRAAGVKADLESMLDEKGRMLEKAGQFGEALAVVREQQALQKKNARTERDRAMAELQEKFDASRRAREISLLKRENELKDSELRSRRTALLATGFAAVLTVLAGAVVLVLYRRSATSNAALKKLNKQLEYHSTRDVLTGLHNRRSFQEKMRSVSEHGKVNRRSVPVPQVASFLLFDIDHFKSINDRWGHNTGDEVLVEVARRLQSAVRDTDMVLRWGGEEFLIYAPETSHGQVGTLVSRVLHAIGGTPVETGSGAIPVTITAGVAALPIGTDDNTNWELAVRLADWALYQGKKNHRNQAQIIGRVHAPAEQALAVLEGRASGDARALLELQTVAGPGQDTQR